MKHGLKLLTAGRGEGKTTFLREYAVCAAGRGLSVGGVAAPAVFEKGERVGYDLIDLRRGSRRPLARIVSSPGAKRTAGMYWFDEAAEADGNAAIISAIQDRLDVVAIDEVGPREFLGGGLVQALSFALRELSPEQELILVVRPSLVDELPHRFPSPRWETVNRISPPWPRSR
ncbi:MAG: nucleoside-triphosphatase [Planctomycetota bacterium]